MPSAHDNLQHVVYIADILHTLHICWLGLGPTNHGIAMPHP